MKTSFVHKFIVDQLSVWPMAAANFRSLKSAEIKTFTIGGMTVYAQCNPARIRSSMAGEKIVWETPRGCFLCESTRPPEQTHLPFEGRKGRLYHIQINPYPIFPEHLVIARDEHTAQTLSHTYVDMLDLARKINTHAIFYNGPCCGASKPDHMHFQACPLGLMPLQKAVSEDIVSNPDKFRYLCQVREADLYRYEGYTRGVFVLRAETSKSMAKLFYRLLDCMPVPQGESEPRANVIAWYESGEWRSIVVARKALRAHFFNLPEESRFTMSIGCADIAGYFIVPVVSQFERIDTDVLEATLDEVVEDAEVIGQIEKRLTRTQQTVEVGILSAREIAFEIISDGAGVQHIKYADGHIDYNGYLYDELTFDAVTPSSLFAEPSFILHDSSMSVNQHFSPLHCRKYAGALRFVVEGENITAINRVGLEDYLLSVISSGTKDSDQEESLRMRAVTLRSQILSQLGRHELYDFCSDDHCRLYEGLGANISANARTAVDASWGQIAEEDLGM